jgi:serine protease Do
MNKVIIALMPWIFAAIGYKATAQETTKKEEKKETQVITIKKTGDKNTDLKIEFKNDAVFINGKPLVEFKDDAITINNKKIVVRNGDKFSIMGDDGKAALEWDVHQFEGMGDRIVRGFGFGGGRTYLGVSTEKDDAGAKISEVIKESAAEKAGLEKGDIITKIGDTKIEGPGDVSNAISSKKPKEEVKITYKRNGKEKTTKASLQERKDINVQSYSFSGPGGDLKTLTVPGYPATPGAPRGLYRGDNDNFNFDSDVFINGYGTMNRPRLGLKIQDLEEGSGVKVLEVEEGSVAEKAGLKKDDIVVAVGDAKVNNTDEAREQLRANAEKSAYSIEAKRNGSPMKFEIKIPKKLKTANL